MSTPAGTPGGTPGGAGAPPPAWEWIGSPTARLRLGGHSNRSVFELSQHLLPDDLRGRVAALGVPRRYVWPDDRYWDLLAAAPGRLAVVWNGNQHNVYFLLHGRPVTVVGPRGRLPAGPVLKPVPYRMVRALWGPGLEELDALLRRRTDPAPVLVVGTPPPKAEPDVRRALAADKHFGPILERYGLTAETAPVTDVATRVAAWESLQEEMGRVARAAGAVFVPVPAEAQDADGALRPEYGYPDCTHAGVDPYGPLMWRRVAQHAGLG